MWKFVPKGFKRFVRKVIRQGYRLFGTAILRLFPVELSDRSFCDALTDLATLDRFVEAVRARGSPFVFTTKREREGILGILRSERVHDVEVAIMSAEDVCGHLFNLLGSGRTNIDTGGGIAWNMDFKSGALWPEIYFKGMGDLEDLDKRSDIKVPWELSRSQHFIGLGKAYVITGDEKYAREFVGQIRSWIHANPVRLGVNWVCTMDVAIRAANWLVGFQFFKDSPSLDNKFVVEFYKSILLHGRHIMSNLENSGVTTNHYLSNIAGLLCIAVLFPEAHESEGWKRFAVSELKKEMFKQVNEDGMDFEGSTCYHRLVLELFFFTVLLSVRDQSNEGGGDYIKNAERIFGPDFVERLRGMFEFVLATTKPNGMMPQIGDNDNGRYLIFSEKPILDSEYLLDFAAIFFNDSKFRLKEFKLSEDSLWIFGSLGYNSVKRMPVKSVWGVPSAAFRQSGVYVIRANRTFLIIHCAGNGQRGLGGHSHNDALSFEMNIDGRDLIVDPGTYLYTADYRSRNEYRSSFYHNAVTIDGTQPARFNEREMFRMLDDVRTEVSKWEMTDFGWVFVGEHYGYERGDTGVGHRRKIEVHKSGRKAVITDSFYGDGRHSLLWNLTLSPEEEQRVQVGSNSLHWRRGPTFYSPEYGVQIQTESLRTEVESDIPCEFHFEICAS